MHSITRISVSIEKVIRKVNQSQQESNCFTLFTKRERCLEAGVILFSFLLDPIIIFV